MDPMTLFALAAAAMTVVILGKGLGSMLQGGALSTRLMFQRTAWQAVAVALVLLGMLTQA